MEIRYVQTIRFYALTHYESILWSNFLHDTGHIRDLGESLWYKTDYSFLYGECLFFFNQRWEFSECENIGKIRSVNRDDNVCSIWLFSLSAFFLVTIVEFITVFIGRLFWFLCERINRYVGGYGFVQQNQKQSGHLHDMGAVRF